MLVNAMLLARALAARSSKRCSPAPPDTTFQFFDGRPPKATKRSVCAKISRHSVTAPDTSSTLPMTCGKTIIAAPKL